jgi:hypothetical protein
VRIEGLPFFQGGLMEPPRIVDNPHKVRSRIVRVGLEAAMTPSTSSIVAPISSATPYVDRDTEQAE